MSILARIRGFEFIYLVSSVVIVIIYHAKDFGLPALWPDETSYFIMSLSMIYPKGSELYNFAGSLGFHIGSFPIQFSPYIGVLGSYISVPFQFFFGPTVTAIRLYSLAAALLLVITTYFAGRELFSKRVGFISTSLLLVFPTFVFYSRQNISYEWFLLSFALIIVTFGVHFLRTLKIKYLFIALVLIGIGVWEYLWFLWFVFGLVVTTPIWLKSLTTQLKRSDQYNPSSKSILKHANLSKGKLLAVSFAGLFTGIIPFITFYFVSPYWSIIPFLYRTIIGGDSSYMTATNANLFGNLIMRAHHFFEIFAQPSTGFIIANVNYTSWNETSYVFLVLLFTAIISCIIYLIFKRPVDKKIFGLLILVGTIFLSSIVTVTSFTNLQLGIMLPFVFLLIGKGIDIISTSQIIQGKFSARNRVTPNKIILGILIVIVILQIPIILQGYKLMESSETSQYKLPYQKINQYIKEKDLVPVTFDFFTNKNFLFDTNGEQVPYILHGKWEGAAFNDEIRKTMKTAESLGLADKKFLFVVYTYPQIEECNEDTVTNIVLRSNQCAEYYFVESAAKRNNLKVDTTDFKLPDGTPYLRGLRFIDK